MIYADEPSLLDVRARVADDDYSADAVVCVLNGAKNVDSKVLADMCFKLLKDSSEAYADRRAALDHIKDHQVKFDIVSCTLSLLLRGLPKNHSLMLGRRRSEPGERSPRLSAAKDRS